MEYRRNIKRLKAVFGRSFAMGKAMALATAIMAVAAVTSVTGGAQQAMAFTIAPKNQIVKPAQQQQNPLLHKTKIIGKDGRQFFDQYAEQKKIELSDFQKKFGGVGAVGEADRWITAQITEFNDVVTSAAHIFYDENCVQIPLTNFKFKVRLNGEVQFRKIKPGTLVTGGCGKNRREDWAFFQIEKPIEGVKPFLAPQMPVDLYPMEQVTVASYYAMNFPSTRGDQRHIQSCQIRVVKNEPTSKLPLQVDCDTGGGTSGSALLQEKPEGLTIVGVVNSEFIDGKDGDEFLANKSGNVGTGFNGEFYLQFWEKMNKRFQAATTPEDSHGIAVDLGT